MNNVKESVFFKNEPLQLIYRLSEHGEKAEEYHACCDGKSNVIVLIKSTKGKVFGGYRSAAIGADIQDPTAFIFSVSSERKFELKPNSEYGIVDNEDEGPLFGNDIQICDCPKTNKESSSCFGDDYVLP